MGFSLRLASPVCPKLLLSPKGFKTGPSSFGIFPLPAPMGRNRFLKPRPFSLRKRPWISLPPQAVQSGTSKILWPGLPFRFPAVKPWAPEGLPAQTCQSLALPSKASKLFVSEIPRKVELLFLSQSLVPSQPGRPRAPPFG